MSRSSFSFRSLICRLAAVCLVGSSTLCAADKPILESLRADPQSGTAAAVIVGGVALAHTAQIFPCNLEATAAPKDAQQQSAALFDSLRHVLRSVESDLDRVVRLNIYVSDNSVTPAVQAQLRQRFSGQKIQPAVTFAVTRLPPGNLVALDAVAASAAKVDRVTHKRLVGPKIGGPAGAAHVTILPPGRAVYISGQAEPGKTMAEATRKTLEGLQKTLKHIGLDKAHIVQVKSFMQPVTDSKVVDAEIASFFGGTSIPACTHVEWIGGSPSIETELVVWDPGTGAKAGEHGAADFVYLPWMSVSPNFCRLTNVDQHRTIYIGGIYARTTESPEAEVRDTLQQLRELLKLAGSDFDHLAKATYYPSTDDTSNKLNTIRPEFYNPKRPPAASKAVVKGTGRADRNLTIDFIAVTPAK